MGCWIIAVRQDNIVDGLWTNFFSPNPDEQVNSDDHLLENLAAATSLFNPDQLWQREVELDALDEQGADPESPDSAESAVI